MTSSTCIKIISENILYTSGRELLTDFWSSYLQKWLSKYVWYLGSVVLFNNTS